MGRACAQPKGWRIWGTAASSWAATWEDLLGKQLVMLEKLVEFWPRRALSAELRSVASFYCRWTLPDLRGSHTGAGTTKFPVWNLEVKTASGGHSLIYLN